MSTQCNGSAARDARLRALARQRCKAQNITDEELQVGIGNPKPRMYCVRPLYRAPLNECPVQHARPCLYRLQPLMPPCCDASTIHNLALQSSCVKYVRHTRTGWPSGYPRHTKLTSHQSHMQRCGSVLQTLQQASAQTGVFPVQHRLQQATVLNSCMLQVWLSWGWPREEILSASAASQASAGSCRTLPSATLVGVWVAGV